MSFLVPDAHLYFSIIAADVEDYFAIRMILRGQGDSAVRICDPCKKLEDAARFELRYGHKTRGGKGSLRLEPKNEQEVLDQIAGAEGKQHLSIREPQSVLVSDLQRATNHASSSNFPIESIASEGKGDVLRSISIEMHNNTLKEMESKSPEELRQQAAEEKKKHRILKAEGKPEEALQAFKRGKELERQAAALEIALRKSRRMASALNNSSSSERKDDGHEVAFGKRSNGSQSSRVAKDDLLSELKDLGWSDADLHETDKKPENLSLEGELSRIIKDIPSKSSTGRGTNGIDNSQVLAHKRKALMLKREGKLAEAKEELKKAKLLEKQLEEQELLGQADDSDDELSALTRSIDDDEQDDQLADYGHDLHVNFNHMSGLDDLAFDDNFDVTADDMNDPELAAALRSFGWREEDDNREEESPQPVLRSREALESEILSLKRVALKHKHAGNTSEAMALLKKAKLLEKDLENTPHVTAALQKESMQQKSEGSSMSEADVKNIPEMKGLDHRPKPKSKLLIQRELLDLKKRALALRREGRTDEADEELRRGKELELQLQEMENAPNIPSAIAPSSKKKREVASVHQDISANSGFDEEETADVTEEDMSDPALLSVLNNLGWVDEHAESASNTSGSSKQANDQSTQEISPPTIIAKVLRSKAEIQRELLGIKRKALALRRQGKTQEADDELEKAKSLEKQMAEMEVQHLPAPLEMKTDVSSDLISVEKSKVLLSADVSGGVLPTSSSKNEMANNDVNPVDIYDMAIQNRYATSAPPTLSDRSSTGISKLEPSATAQEKQVMVDQCTTSSGSGISLNQEDLPTGDGSSWHATGMKQKSKGGQNNVSVEHATPDLLTDDSGKTKLNEGESAGTSNAVDKKQTVVTTTERIPSNEADASQGFDYLSEQILARKRKAVALKREGKLAEAREELRQAKHLEKSLEEGKNEVHATSQSSSASTTSSSSGVSDSKHQKPMSSRDRLKLQQESLAHKRQALKLRREGRIEESDAELELAKALEAQLEEIDNQNSENKKGVMDDTAVDDLLDPQLLSALKSIGWAESDILMHPQEKPAPKLVAKNVNSSPQGRSEVKSSSIPGNSNISPEKAILEEQIKAEKLRAVNLKRSGKQAEAMEALRSAKRLEKRLMSLN
ncbi:hypothetical protein Taro_019128 [Colocasia esculenta]|uniref:Uncharacterized protein n=1 Tax=Colocasia esculenta TaxID=4460 RepID=A0A843V186_COLES|nr:hypothetical protein [Colocasia esculenta]